MATGLDNLKIHKMAELLELEIHELTKSFPQDERYRSIDQLKRSSSAITNNIAEAYNKKSKKEQIHILNDIAKCEAEETKRNLMISVKKGFHDNHKIIDDYTELIKAISGYIRFLRNNLQLINLQTYKLKSHGEEKNY